MGCLPTPGNDLEGASEAGARQLHRRIGSEPPATAKGHKGPRTKPCSPATTRAGDSQVDSQARIQRGTSADLAGMATRNFGLNGRCWTVTEPLPRICKQGVRVRFPSAPLKFQGSSVRSVPITALGEPSGEPSSAHRLSPASISQ